MRDSKLTSATAWRVRYQKSDGWFTFADYSYPDKRPITKDQVATHANNEVKNNPEYESINEIYPID